MFLKALLVFYSLCFPLHPGLHDGLHWDPTGGQREPGVHSGGPWAAAGCLTGQYDCNHSIELLPAPSHLWCNTYIWLWAGWTKPKKTSACSAVPGLFLTMCGVVTEQVLIRTNESLLKPVKFHRKQKDILSHKLIRTKESQLWWCFVAQKEINAKCKAD